MLELSVLYKPSLFSVVELRPYDKQRVSNGTPCINLESLFILIRSKEETLRLKRHEILIRISISCNINTQKFSPTT